MYVCCRFLVESAVADPNSAEMRQWMSDVMGYAQLMSPVSPPLVDTMVPVLSVQQSGNGSLNLSVGSVSVLHRRPKRAKRTKCDVVPPVMPLYEVKAAFDKLKSRSQVFLPGNTVQPQSLVREKSSSQVLSGPYSLVSDSLSSASKASIVFLLLFFGIVY